MSKEIIYFDNAATSCPKPKEVLNAMHKFMTEKNANPGRSGHSMSVDASRVVFDAREMIAEFFGLSDSSKVSFTLNATYAINIALKGVLENEDNVITSSMEHNSVLRPLNNLQKEKNISITKIPCDNNGNLDMNSFKNSFKSNTKLVVINHGSNVIGNIQNIKEIGKVCKSKGVVFLVDSAQSAGTVNINMTRDNIDILAFTGHKGLLGPQGVGGLCVGERIEIKSLFQGGTGSLSEEEIQPSFMPDKLEAGTLNAVGIAGLLAGLKFIKKIGLNNIKEKEDYLTEKLIKGLLEINGIKVYSENIKNRLSVVSFNIDNLSPSDVGYMLDNDFNIMSRVGLHCAPIAHKTIGTFPQGTVRLSMNYFNTKEEVECVLNAIKQIKKKE